MTAGTGWPFLAIRQSMSRKGYPSDNAVAENFFSYKNQNSCTCGTMRLAPRPKTTSLPTLKLFITLCAFTPLCVGYLQIALFSAPILQLKCLVFIRLLARLCVCFSEREHYVILTHSKFPYTGNKTLKTFWGICVYRHILTNFSCTGNLLMLWE